MLEGGGSTSKSNLCPGKNVLTDIFETLNFLRTVRLEGRGVAVFLMNGEDILFR
jgi:hypothetical protein